MSTQSRTPSNWIAVADSQLTWEEEALRIIRDKFPPGADYHAWSNFEFLAANGSIKEVGLLVGLPWGIFMVEIKSRPSCLSGDQAVWSWTSSEGRRHTVATPFLLTNRKAKHLKSSLASQSALRKFMPPFIQPFLFCLAETLHISVAEETSAELEEEAVPTEFEAGIKKASAHAAPDSAKTKSATLAVLDHVADIAQRNRARGAQTPGDCRSWRHGQSRSHSKGSDRTPDRAPPAGRRSGSPGALKRSSSR
jgi:hypothetical protein